MKPIIDSKVKSLTTRICLALLLICIAVNGGLAAVYHYDSRLKERELQKLEEQITALEKHLQAIDDTMKLQNNEKTK